MAMHRSYGISFLCSWSSCSRAFALVLALALLACKPRVQVETPSPFDEDDPEAQPAGELAQATSEDDLDSSADAKVAALGAPGTPGAKHRGLAAKSRRATISRSALNAVLDRGPGMFLRGIEIAASLEGNRFYGWQIVQFMPGESRFDAYDLQPGDIIGAINGRLIVRPQHLAALWDELRAASRIVIAVSRHGRPFELQFDITEEAGAAPP